MQRNRIAFSGAAAGQDNACISQATTRPAWRRKSSMHWPRPTPATRSATATTNGPDGSSSASAEMFEKEVAVFLVPTGTVANALAIAHLTPPWGAVLCHADSHIATDECGAPEFFGGGIKLIGLTGEGAKISAATLARRAGRRRMGRTAPCHARGALALAGDRMRHDLSRRRGEGARRHRAQARRRAAHGRRAHRQCARAHECLARRS